MLTQLPSPITVTQCEHCSKVHRPGKVCNYKKWLARKRVEKALLYGKLVKPKTCPKCGSGGQIDGHHEDYDDPLRVDWMCQKCHQILHFPLLLLHNNKT